MKRNEINFLLFEARQKKGVDIKVAAKELKISKLKLSLIERGYLRPHLLLRKRLISYYSLNNDFFSKNSRHIYPIDKDKSSKGENKLFKFVRSKKCSILSFVSLFVFSGVLAMGFVNLNFRFSHPDAYFTDTLKVFNENFKKIEEVKQSEDKGYDDIKYTYTKKYDERASYNISLNSYGKKCNIQNTNMYMSVKLEHDTDTFLLIYTVFSSNQNICITSNITYLYEENINEKKQASYSIYAYFNSDKTISTYEISNGESMLDKKTDEFVLVESDFKAGVEATFEKFDILFKDHDIGYKDTKSLLADIKSVAVNNTFRYRLGFVFLFISAFFLPLSLFFLGFSHILRLKARRKNVVGNAKCYDHGISIPYRTIPNDIRFTPFVPEFVLKIISIALVMLYSIAVNLAINDRLNIHLIIGDQTLNTFQKYASTFLIGGILLMFFVKLDINHKKSIKESVFNIVLLFIGGLIFYLSEIILFTVVNKKENILSRIISLFINFIPGNIFWSLLMYSCVYFFLFVTPKNIEKDFKKIRIFRLLSLIPTSVLVFALLFRIYISKNENISFYISCLFYTKSALLTSFAVLYLYFLFFYRSILVKKYGIEQCEIYFESSRYNMFKNIIASSIIVILFAVDLWFKYKMPNNALKLGKNWAIIILLPFVLFYRSHIGKRDKKLDLTFQGLYIISLSSTYLVTVIMFVAKLNLGVLFKFLA